MKVSIKKASIQDLDALNEVFRLSKASWGYDNHFMQQCMANQAITTERIKKGNIYLFQIEKILAGFYSFSYECEPVELDYFFYIRVILEKDLGEHDGTNV